MGALRANARFSKVEEATLLTLVGSMSLYDLAERLQRSPKAIRNKLSRMGVSLRQGYYTLRDLEKIFGVKRHTLGAYRDRGGRSFCKKGERLATDDDVVWLARELRNPIDPRNPASISSKKLFLIETDYREGK